MTLVDQCAGWFSSSGWRLRPLECAHGWTPCGVVQKDRAVVRQASPIGDSSWHERSNCSLKSRNRRKRILFEVPRNYINRDCISGSLGNNCRRGPCQRLSDKRTTTPSAVAYVQAPATPPPPTLAYRPKALRLKQKLASRSKSCCTIMCGAISRFQYYCAGETIGACKMP